MKSLLAFALLAFAVPVFAVPPTLVLKDKNFGEQSTKYVMSGNFIGNQIAANTVLSNITGSTAYPVANTYAAVSAKLMPAMLLTGFVSGAGTVSGADTVLQAINKLSGDLQNLPAISNVLTGFSAGAGTISAADSILAAFQKLVGNLANMSNGKFIPTIEAVTDVGALSTTIMQSNVSNVTAGTYAVTLAAPSSQDGQMKVIKAIATMSHTVTLALTNVSMSGGYTPAGTTTLTFTNAGDSAVFMAVGGKWVYLGGSAGAS